MKSTTKPIESNEARGLVLHVDPANPTGPLVAKRPDMTKRAIVSQGKKPKARKKAKSRPEPEPPTEKP